MDYRKLLIDLIQENFQLKDKLEQIEEEKNYWFRAWERQKEAEKNAAATTAGQSDTEHDCIRDGD